MPRVPTYDNLVATPNRISSGAIQTAVSPNTAGTTGQAWGSALQTLGNAASNVAIDLTLKNRARDEKALIDSKLNDFYLFDFNQSRSLTEFEGQNAIGLTDRYLKGAQDEINRLIENVPDHLKQSTINLMRNHAINRAQSYSTYEAGEKRKWHVSTLNETIETKFNLMLNAEVVAKPTWSRTTDPDGNVTYQEAEYASSWGDPKWVQDSMEVLRLRIKDRALSLGESSEKAHNDFLTMQSDFYSQRMMRIKTEQPRSFNEYFEHYKDKIQDPKIREALRVEAKETKTYYELYDEVDALIKETKMRNYESYHNGGFGKDLIRRLEDEKAQMLQFKKPEDRQLYTKIFDDAIRVEQNLFNSKLSRALDVVVTHGMNNGWDLSTAPTSEYLFLKRVDSLNLAKLEDYAEKQRKGEPVVTDSAAVIELYDLAIKDREKFLGTNMNNYITRLSTSDMKSMMILKRSIADDDSYKNTLTALQFADNFGKALQFKDEKLARWKIQFTNEVEEAQLQKKRKLSRDELNDLAQSLIKPGNVSIDWGIDRSVQRFEADFSGDGEFFYEEGTATTIRDVPQTDIDQIREEFRKRGAIVPSDQQIIDLYNRANGFPKYKTKRGD